MLRRLETGLIALVTGTLALGACGTEGDLTADTDVTVTSSAIVNASNTSTNERYWGDFNGDGLQDMIVVTASGSSEYLAKAGGGFTRDVWVRSDLPLGTVAYVPGHFNGDNITDLLIVTSRGTFEYAGKTGGGFTANVWVRNDLTLGTVQYVAGDWDADQITDLIIVRPDASHQYMGRSNGVFLADTWVRDDLKLDAVEFTLCHFGVQDSVVITTGASSALYKGNIGAPGFTKTNWERTDLKLGSVSILAGNWSGPGGDLLVTTASGTAMQMNVGGPRFQADVWKSSAQKLGKVKYTRGNFDHPGGRDDLIITTKDGSFEYTTNSGNGTQFDGFNPDVWVRPTLTLGTVEYFVGNFDDVSPPNDLMIIRAGGTFEYTGVTGGGFTSNVWTTASLTLGNVQLF